MPLCLRKRLLLTRLALVLAWPWIPLAAAAAGDGAIHSGRDACGFALGGAIWDTWTALGGAAGSLGCPASAEGAAAPSPHGSTGEQVLFGAGGGGAIIRHRTGPHAGQTFAVAGCVFRLYFQFGGSGGWLGFPTSGIENTPDGRRQSFEGGEIVQVRATDSCNARRANEIAAAPAAAGGKTRLDLFENAAGGAFALATAAGAAQARAEGYRPVSTLGYVFNETAAGLTPLKTYWNPATGDHDTVASAEDERADLAAGYEFDGLQGFIWTEPRPGARVLKRFWNPQSRSSLMTSSPEGDAAANAKGFGFARIEGYAAAEP